MSTTGPSRRREGKDPWEHAPTGELSDQLLPRWFVLLALVLLPLALIVGVVAYFSGSGGDIGVAERRPPPNEPHLTHEVGAYEVGPADPVAYEAPCADLDAVRIAGADADQAALRQGLAAVCNAPRAEATSEALQAFGAAGGVVRFGLFEATGVDVVVDTSGDDLQLLVNARYTDIQPSRSIGPVVVYGAVTWAGDPASAETAVAAREAEAAVCETALAAGESTRACADAAELLELDDPLAALREAGFN